MSPLSLCLVLLVAAPQDRPRLRDLGVVIGQLPAGPNNAITDVEDVRVGHATVVEGDSVRTGVTVVMPHGDNVFMEKVPAAIAVANGYGKLIGYTQVRELGTLESPIALTNTLNVGLVADALVGHVLGLPKNERVRSVNVVVGETNDGRLNDIRGRHVKAKHVAQAIAQARGGEVEEGCVGAGTGTVCFGWKGGIGTSSRVVHGGKEPGHWTVGVLVQTNFGGDLTIAGVPIHEHLKPTPPTRRQERDREPEDADDGSCMIVIATDAPLSARNLERLARRSFAGMARTGASFSNGSGDYAIAFTTDRGLRTGPGAAGLVRPARVLDNASMSPFFRAVAEATEEAIINSLCQAVTTESRSASVPALAIDRLRELLGKQRR